MISKNIVPTAALVLATAACAASPATDYFDEPFPSFLPTDVRLFVVDAQACTHFAGEEGFDADRQAFLDSAMAKACPKLDKRKAELTSRYCNSPQIKKMILDAWEE